MPSAEMRRLAEAVLTGLGFDAWGFAPAERVGRADYLPGWLSAGRAGEMRYLRRWPEQRVDASVLVPGARTVIVAALNYHQPEPLDVDQAGGPRGRIARYAWGLDYHRVVRERLGELVTRLRAASSEPFKAMICVDGAPLLEREYALRAGVGWIGKNTMVLNQRLGSYFVLGEVVTTLALPCDEPAVDHCGTCRRCLDACPTGAFLAPYQMDATRCISYLTIECRAPELPGDLAADLGNWVFGCDICQEVCPYNRGAPLQGGEEHRVQSPAPRPLLSDLLTWGNREYRRRLRDRALRRARPFMWRRNARIALENEGRSQDARL